ARAAARSRARLLAGSGPDRRLDGSAIAVADIADPDRRADAHQTDPEAQLVGVPLLAPVDRDDHVAGLEPGLLGRGPRLDLRDQRAALDVEVERLRQRRRHRLDVHAEPAAADLAVLDQLLHDAAGHVRRHGEA